MALENFQKYLPEHLWWQPEKGLVKGEGEKQKFIASAVPVVLRRFQVSDYVNHCSKKLLKLQFKNCQEIMIGDVLEFTEEEIMSGKFMQKLPIEVQAGCSNQTLRNIYKQIIQAQITEKELEHEEIFPFGWTGKHFCWLEDEMQIFSKELECETVAHVVSLADKENPAIAALILALLHGPVIKVLQQANIHHNFVTFVKGSTGVGKTATSKRICECLRNRKTVVSLGSKRTELQKFIQGTRDITIIIDDLCTSASDRVISAQLQSVSDIIQAAGDAGMQILDESSMDKADNCVHLVITSEKVIKNPATMNRCFLINMEESLPDDVWNQISYMSEQRCFFVFLYAFLKYIEGHYDEVVAHCKANYPLYLKSERAFMTAEDHSMNRIAETLAIQHTISGLLVGYIKSAGIDEELCNSVKKSISRCIDACGEDLKLEIREMQKEEKHWLLLPVLAVIFKSDGNGYEFAKNEEKYRKAKQKKKKIIGFQNNRGYVSFDPSYMCQMIEAELDYALAQDLNRESHVRLETARKAVSKSRLSKELSYHHLAHVDYAEQKQCCRWHTEYKYFHVHFGRLLELAYEMDPIGEFPFWMVENFEKSFDSDWD